MMHRNLFRNLTNFDRRQDNVCSVQFIRDKFQMKTFILYMIFYHCHRQS